MTHGQLQALHLGEPVDVLESIGFAPNLTIGATRIVGVGEGRGVVGASLAGVSELDGLELIEPGAHRAGSEPHPNGVVSIDHVVVMTPNPDRTQAAFEENGLEARRMRRFETKSGSQRQTFFWLGDVICEVVGPDGGTGDGKARWWGLALTVADIEATAAFLGDRAGAITSAVQPGRRVTTLHSPDTSTPILFISAHVSDT